MDKFGTKEGHLVIFDRMEKSWDEKIFRKTETYNSSKIIVQGM